MSTSTFMQLAHAKRGGSHVNLCPDPQGATVDGPFWPTTIFDVMDYGAVHDNSTDDVAAIQTAINEAAATGGGIVYLEAGTYCLEQGHSFFPGGGCCLELRSGVFMRGDGPGNTLLNCTNTIGAGHFGGDFATTMGVSDLEMYFRMEPTPSYADTIKLYVCTDFVMSNVVMHDGIGASTNFIGCINVLVKDCVAYNFDTAGFASTNGGNLADGTLNGNYNSYVNCEAYAAPVGFSISGKTSYGGWAYPSRQKNALLRNCYAHDITVWGINTPYCEDILVEDCVVEDSGDRNIYVTGVAGGHFHNITYRGTGGTAVYVVVNAPPDEAAYAHYGGASTDIVED